MKSIISTILSGGFLVLGCSFYAVAQQKSESLSDKEKGKSYIVEYLNAFDNYINNPQVYEINRSSLIEKFGHRTGKDVIDFTSGKRRKPYVKPINLLKSIESDFSDGFGMAYHSDSIIYIAQKNGPFSSTYVYRTPVEYSGLRNDGSMLSYTRNQYFYLKQKRSEPKPKIVGVSDSRYYAKKFKKEQYRVGLFVEPFLVFGNSAYISYYEYKSVYNGENSYSISYQHKGESFGDMFADIEDIYFGFDAIYMIKPFFGLGTGVSWMREKSVYDIEANNYPLFQNFGYQYYVDTYQNQTFGYFYHTTKLNGIALPLFIRLQTGMSYLSFSLDLGGGLIINPTMDNYLSGEIMYYGVSLETGQANYHDPVYGFDRYVFYGDANFVGRNAPKDNLEYIFGRLNTTIQFNKFFYSRLSLSFKHILNIHYDESRHMFDMFALRLPKAENHKWLNTSNFELSFGFNVFEMIFIRKNR